MSMGNMMSKNDGLGHRNIQLQIPNANETINVPTLKLSDSLSNASIRVPLDDVFNEVSQSYQNDPEALHRFSYYLLLHAQGFAQNINITENVEIVNFLSEEC
jgi:hypothetical protein